MTARTHDLAAFTGLILVGVFGTIPQMSLATLIACVFANMMGGLAPDIDEGTAEFWQKFRGGSVVGKLIAPLLGGHRLFSHSLFGLWIVGKVVHWLLDASASVILVDMSVVWGAFMIGYVSHLVTDAVTKEGVPLFFPLPFSVGFPPFRRLRLTTGKFAEKALVFPGLVCLNGYLLYHNYGTFLEIFKRLV